MIQSQKTPRNRTIEILHESFKTNPSMLASVVNDRSIDERLKFLVKYLIKDCEIIENRNTVIAYCSSLSVHRSSFLSKLKLIFKTMNFQVLKDVIQAEKVKKQIRKTLYPSDFIYVQMVGTKPSAQGRGFGTSLFKKFISTQSLPIFLETSNVQNLPFYERLGFQVIEKQQLKKYNCYFLTNQKG